MIKFKNSLTDKEVSQLRSSLLCYDDKYGEAYVTKDNVRLSMKDGADVIISRIKKGDIIAFSDEFKSFAIISGVSEKMPRKYLKVFGTDKKDLINVLKVLFWEYREEIYIRLKKYNPLVKFLTQEFYFYFYRPRDNDEIILKKEKNKYPKPKYVFDKDAKEEQIC
jgi:hypothetical protein